jgi:hypothetical protein
MRTNERFLEALKYMNATMKADNAIGHQWKYCNVSSQKAKGGFEEKRKKKKFLTNCVDGVQDALRIAGVDALAWYGGNGKIVWLNDHAKADAKKYFDIISTGGKTVNQLHESGRLCDGDILLGYQGFAHTNVYYGGQKSFDSGHAFCIGRGEGAKFKKWIGQLVYKGTKVNYILRLKDRTHYRVQAGAFSSIEECQKQKSLMHKKKFSVEIIQEEGMYKIQAGYFNGKTNAERFAAKLAKAGIASFVKEVT